MPLTNGAPLLWLGAGIIYLAGCARAADRPVETPEARLRKILIAHSELIDPFSTEFRDLRHHADSTTEIWCGQLNSRNRMGAFVGWQSFAITVRPFLHGNLADSVGARPGSAQEVEISMEPSSDADEIGALMEALWWRQAFDRYCAKATPARAGDSRVVIRTRSDTIQQLAKWLADSSARAGRTSRWGRYSEAEKEAHARECVELSRGNDASIRRCLTQRYGWPPAEAQTYWMYR